MSGSIKHYIIPTKPDTLGVSVELTPYVSENTWLNENWHCSDQGQTLTMLSAFFLSMPVLKKLCVRFADIGGASSLVYGIVRAILEASTQGKGISNELVGKNLFDNLPLRERGLELVFELEKLGTGDHTRLSIKLCNEHSGPDEKERVISTDDYFGFNNHGFRAEQEKYHSNIRYQEGVKNLFRLFTGMRQAVCEERPCHLVIANAEHDASFTVVRNGEYRGLLVALIAEIPYMAYNQQTSDLPWITDPHPVHRIGYHDVIGMVELGWSPNIIGLQVRTFDDVLIGYVLKMSKNSLSVSFDVL